MPSGNLSSPAPIDPAQVDRFRVDLLALTEAAPSPRSPVGIAVSGGADSLALLLLAHAAFPGCVAAATVDHGLRPAAATEALEVAMQCDRLGVPHTTLRAGARPGTGNLQHWARAERYRLLADWAQAAGIAQIATAHQRDDVAEAFLMRAARRAGVRSLAAMPRVRTLAGSPVLLIRPLLDWSRAELAAIVAAADVTPAIDPSNADPRFDRARVRQLLATTPDLPADALADTAVNLRDVEEAIEWIVARELAVRFRECDDGVDLDASGLPFEIKRRLAARAIEAVRQQQGLLAPWRETSVAALVRSLDSGGGATVADVLATVRGAEWRFRPAPPRRQPKSDPNGPK